MSSKKGFVGWAKGEQCVNLQVSGDGVNVMDLMGNTRNLPSVNGALSVPLSDDPVYISGSGAIRVDRRLGVSIHQGTTQKSQPMLSVEIKNNGECEIAGTVELMGRDKSNEVRFNVKPGETVKVPMPAAETQTNERMVYRARVRTSDGLVYNAAAGLDFVAVVRASKPPALDGAWTGWENAQVVECGKDKSEIQLNDNSKYRGSGDILGKFRLMWDDRFLYLGVEALDDVFMPVAIRGASIGHTADCIEFGFQPENNLKGNARQHEFEMYLPQGESVYCASRRFPVEKHTKDSMITHWRASVTLVDARSGNVNYQVAIPWEDIELDKPTEGKTLSFSLVLDDRDSPDENKKQIHWFSGISPSKDPSQYGDITLVR